MEHGNAACSCAACAVRMSQRKWIDSSDPAILRRVQRIMTEARSGAAQASDGPFGAVLRLLEKYGEVHAGA